jgi:hypothetical protein
VFATVIAPLHEKVAPLRVQIFLDLCDNCVYKEVAEDDFAYIKYNFLFSPRILASQTHTILYSLFYRPLSIGQQAVHFKASAIN